MQKIVDCKLVINRVIDNKKDSIIETGKGYYKKETNETIIFFSNAIYKYKFIYENEELTIMCNNSLYKFKLGVKMEGKMKSGEYTFVVTTLASKIEIKDNSILLDYNLYQQENLIGTYYSELSFY